MQIAVLSDIHANLEAFRRVLDDIESRRTRVDEIISLGDTLGYGPEPEACMALLRKSAIVSVQGNHELAVAKSKYRQWFNPQSRKALHRTCELVSDETVAYIRELPPFLIRHSCLFVHGLPPNSAFRYLYEIKDDDLADLFSRFAEAVAFVGHTHELERISWNGRRAMRHPLEKGQHLLDRSSRHIINIGAVGQPRDGDNRAKYVLWNTDTWALNVRFVAYDIEAAMARAAEDRFSDAATMRQALENLYQGWRDQLAAVCKGVDDLTTGPFTVDPGGLRSVPIKVGNRDARARFALDSLWRPEGLTGRNVKAYTKHNDGTVYDASTGLQWQRVGSEFPVTWTDAHAYVADINTRGFAGESDWRLPTVDELVSLLERPPEMHDLCLPPVFDPSRPILWTCVENLIRPPGSSVPPWPMSAGRIVRADSMSARYVHWAEPHG